MASRHAQSGLLLRTYSADQIYALERIDGAVFDRILAAVNKGDRKVAQTVYKTLSEKRDAGYLLTPMTEELYALAQHKLGRAPRLEH